MKTDKPPGTVQSLNETERLLHELQLLRADLEKQKGELLTARAEIDLARESLKLYELLAKNSRDIILFIRRTDGRILEANTAAIETYGYDKGELLQLTLQQLRTPELLDLASEQMEVADSHGLLFETIHRRKDGTTIPVEVNSQGATYNGTRILLSIIRDVSVRRRTEETLRRAKEEWERTFDSVPDLIAIMDDQHHIVRANRAMVERLGVTWDQCIGLPCFGSVHGTNSPHESCPHSLTLADGCMHEVELHVNRLDGDFIVTTKPLTNEHGDSIGSVHVARDITAHKLAEKALRESEERYRSLFEALQEGFYLAQAIFDDNGILVDAVYLEVNPAFERLLGRQREQIIGKRIRELVPQIKPDWLNVFSKVIRTGEPASHQDFSETFQRHFEALVFRPAPGQFGVLVSDVTDKVETEKQIQLQARMLDSVGQAIIATDMDHSLIYWNKAATNLFGWSAEEVLGQKLTELLPPQEFPELQTEIFASLQRGENWSGELILRNREGRIIPLLTTNSPVFDDQGQPVAIIGIGTDITERKRMENELRQAHGHLEQKVAERTTQLADIVNQLQGEITEREKVEEDLEKSVRDSEDLYNFAPCGYHSLDPDGCFVRVNETELKWLGYEREEMIGKMKIFDILTPASQKIFVDNYPLFMDSGQIFGLRIEMIRKDGTVMPALLNTTAVNDSKGGYLNSRTSVYDITELIRAEENVQRLNRLYQTLSETNKAIVRGLDRDSLFRDFCRIAVEQGGFLLACVVLVSGEDRQEQIVAFCGAIGYLKDIRIFGTVLPEEEGPTGIAIRTGSYHICNDFQNAAETQSWQVQGRSYGIGASASVAIKQGEYIIGAMTMYADKKDSFDQHQEELLIQLGADISFALDNMQREADRRESEHNLRIEIIERLKAVEALRIKDQMLIHQSRLAAMGEMINNIAHQWRQPLNVLGLNIQRLAFFYNSDKFTREFLDTSTRDSMQIIQHMSSTIDDFRNFFKPDKEKIKFDVTQAIQQAINLVDDSFKQYQIQVFTQNGTSATINGYPNEFSQVIMNILQNAGDALLERNIIDKLITITSRSESGKSVVIISDNAGGIDEEIIERIFDPYFSTKGLTGTGIGLYMSKIIVETNMGGRLTVRNLDRGAEFRIEI